MVQNINISANDIIITTSKEIAEELMKEKVLPKKLIYTNFIGKLQEEIRKIHPTKIILDYISPNIESVIKETSSTKVEVYYPTVIPEELEARIELESLGYGRDDIICHHYL